MKNMKKMVAFGMTAILGASMLAQDAVQAVTVLLMKKAVHQKVKQN